MWARCGRDVGEMWRDVGEMKASSPASATWASGAGAASSSSLSFCSFSISSSASSHPLSRNWASMKARPASWSSAWSGGGPPASRLANAGCSRPRPRVSAARAMNGRPSSAISASSTASSWWPSLSSASEREACSSAEPSVWSKSTSVSAILQTGTVSRSGRRAVHLQHGAYQTFQGGVIKHRRGGSQHAVDVSSTGSVAAPTGRVPGLRGAFVIASTPCSCVGIGGTNILPQI
jgi:hypothetical protein